jgi:excisionase family DNA binding protein
MSRDQDGARPVTEGDRYLSVVELAAYSGLSRRTLERHLAHPTTPLPHYKIGGRILVRRAEFDAWIHSQGTSPRIRALRRVEDDVRAVLDRLRARSRTP